MAQQARSFRTGEIIFAEGESGDCAYLIEHGRVLVFLEKDGVEVPLRILGQGEVFGEMSLIDNSPRSASCRSLSETRLITVTKDQLLDRIKAADPVVRLLMQVLLERLRSHNDHVRGKSSALVMPVPQDALAHGKKEAIERIGLENRLSAAIDNDEFVPYYQPIYDLETGAIHGCEALIRWTPPGQPVVLPSMFMDVMEHSSLILRAGRRMIERATEDLKSMLAKFGEDSDFFVSINVSGRQFADPGFVPHLESWRARLGCASRHIKLELTERIMAEGPQTLATLEECRAHGYQLAIDDFGTGFSSLQYLAQMPLTDLKIDRGFVMQVCDDEKALSVVKSLIYLADLLNLKLIAEGIETQEQQALLKGLGVEMGQGFFYSVPMPLADFLKVDTRFQKKQVA